MAIFVAKNSMHKVQSSPYGLVFLQSFISKIESPGKVDLTDFKFGSPSQSEALI